MVKTGEYINHYANLDPTELTTEGKAIQEICRFIEFIAARDSLNVTNITKEE